MTPARAVDHDPRRFAGQSISWIWLRFVEASMAEVWVALKVFTMGHLRRVVRASARPTSHAWWASPRLEPPYAAVAQLSWGGVSIPRVMDRSSGAGSARRVRTERAELGSFGMGVKSRRSLGSFWRRLPRGRWVRLSWRLTGPLGSFGKGAPRSKRVGLGGTGWVRLGKRSSLDSDTIQTISLKGFAPITSLPRIQLEHLGHVDQPVGPP